MAIIGGASAALRAYLVGNSLTNDLYPYGMDQLASGMNRSVAASHHIRSSANLDYIFNNPTDGELTLGGNWNLAFAAKPRSVFSYQVAIPGLNPTSTLLTDVTAIDGFTSAVASGPSVSPRHYVYTGWPTLAAFGSSYQTFWDGAVTLDASTATTIRREYFEHLLGSVAGTVYLIPAGEVLYQIDIAARAGSLSGISTVADLYRDATHMGTVGRFVAASTWLSTVFQKAPSATAAAVATYQSLGGSSLTLTTALAAQIETIVWNVVSTHPLAGVA